MFSIDDYYYDLPDELIAQVPAHKRDGSRLLYVERLNGSLSNHHFANLPRLLKPGDLLVVNNTRVVPARLFGRKESGGQIEILVLEHDHSGPLSSHTRWCLAKSSKRPKRGGCLFFDEGLSGVVEDLGENGLIKIHFHGPEAIDSYLEERGSMPLPPYIRRDMDDNRSTLDRDRYQTVFSREKGAIAAPTAGLHFTNRLIDTLKNTGIKIVEITLHVGHGTFQPVRTKDIRDHRLGEESYDIGSTAADAINGTKRLGKRVIAVGTTVVRALETIGKGQGTISPVTGKTDLMITPGFEFKVIDGMITNFHLPGSSLLFLVSAFGGLDLMRKAYAWAVQKRYRFYSYGDAMLVI